MGFTDFFKAKGKREEFPERRELEIPPAPPTKDELPSFPSPDEVPEFRTPKKRTPLEKAEESALRTQKRELAEMDEREELELKKPIFVYLDSFKEMMDEISLIQTTLNEGSDSIIRITEFKEDEDKEFSRWDSGLKDMQRKLTYVDKVLFGSQK